MRRKHGREDGKDDQPENDRKADDGEPVGGEAPPGDIGAAEPGLQA